MKCSNCGAEIKEGEQRCQYCGNAVNNIQNNVYANQNVEEKNENVVLGVVGAIIGSLAGAVAIILLSQLGVVASASGLAMSFCTLTLYEKFSGKLSKKGIIICILIMLVVTFLAENLAISIQIAKQSRYSTFYVFKNFFQLISYADVVGDYIMDLVLVYVFTAGGAFGIIKTKLNDVKNK